MLGKINSKQRNIRIILDSLLFKRAMVNFDLVKIIGDFDVTRFTQKSVRR